MNNNKVKQMMVDVEKYISLRSGNDNCDDKMWITWLNGACLVTAGANFIWLNTGVVSLTANQLKGNKQ
jgi:hypothetical protein